MLIALLTQVFARLYNLTYHKNLTTLIFTWICSKQSLSQNHVCVYTSILVCMQPAYHLHIIYTYYLSKNTLRRTYPTKQIYHKGYKPTKTNMKKTKKKDFQRAPQPAQTASQPISPRNPSDSRSPRHESLR